MTVISILRGQNTLGIFLAICAKGDNFCDFLFTLLHTEALLKGICSNRKEFVHFGSKFFPYRVDPFSEGGKNNFDSFLYEVVSVPKSFTP